MNEKKMNPFRGFGTVFSFTFKNNTQSKSFKRITIIIALICFLAGVVALSITAFSQGDKNKSYKSPFTTVYFYNKTNLETPAFSSFNQIAGAGYEHVVIKPVKNGAGDWQKTCTESKEEDTVVELSRDGSAYSLELFLADGGASSSDGDELLSVMSGIISQSKLASLGLSQENLQLAVTPVMTEFTTAGNNPESIAQTIVKFALPLVTILIIYMMILMYGQSIGKAVSAEKTSKIIETILTSVAPYALIGGKVLATALVGIIQFIVWGGCIVLGLYAGGFAGTIINSSFVNPLDGFFATLQATQIGSVFTAPSIILGSIALCLGFLFFCVLAGLVASGISKSEEQAQGMSMFQIFVVIGFMFSYFTSLNQSGGLLRELIRWIPVSSAFILPSDIMAGNCSLLMSSVYILVLFVCTVALVIVTGKIYRDTIFYKGTNWFMRLCGTGKKK